LQELITNDLEALSKEISGKCRDILRWKKDDRFNIVLAEFDVDKLHIIFSELKKYFINSWDANTIKSSPEYIQLNSERYGRLHTDQIFCTTNSDNNTFIYCAIWPWSDGLTVSIRLAPYDKTIPEEELDKLREQFRGWFGL